MHDESNKLLFDRNVSPLGLLSCNGGADVYVADGPPIGLFEGKGEDVGGTVMSLVPCVQPTHGVSPEKGDGDRRVPALTAEDGLHRPANASGGEGQPAAGDHHFTAGRLSGIPE